MKKIFLLLIMATTCGVCVMAQESLVATLQHGSDIQAFYGEYALSAAHEAAEDGDIITLSAGEFYGANVTKVITLRGEGTEKTHIKSGITFTIPEKSTRTLFLEGLNMSIGGGDVNFYGSDGSEKVVVSKCYVYSWSHPLSFEKCNGTVIQSNIQGAIYACEGSHVTCLNSIFASPICEGNGKFDVENCVIYNSLSYVHYSTIKNSIISITDPSLDNTNTFSHCLTAGNIAIPVSDFGWTIPGGGYEPLVGILGDNYHLSEEAAATYIGTDGTEIGIYGGMYPFDLTPSYPLVKTLDVIGSHKNGKLNVKINVK